jgi:hypothetical protein
MQGKNDGGDGERQKIIVREVVRQATGPWVQPIAGHAEVGQQQQRREEEPPTGSQMGVADDADLQPG